MMFVVLTGRYPSTFSHMMRKDAVLSRAIDIAFVVKGALFAARELLSRSYTTDSSKCRNGNSCSGRPICEVKPVDRMLVYSCDLPGEAISWTVATTMV